MGTNLLMGLKIMGMDISTYIGVVVKIKLNEQARSTTIYSCSNSECENHERKIKEDKNFCDKCGTELSNVSISVTSVKSFNDFVNVTRPNGTLKLAGQSNDIYTKGQKYGYEDVLVCPEYLSTKGEEVLIDNFDIFGTTSENFGFDSLVLLDPIREIEKFKEAHHYLINDLNSFFGSENIMVDFGVAQYAY
jgi:hypothetical protein